MINDSHIHIGQYYNRYTTALSLTNFLNIVHVKYFAVFSTSIWEDNYYKVIGELIDICRLCPNRAIPIMWFTNTTPIDKQFNFFHSCPISWKGVKMHTIHGWANNQIEEVVHLCQQYMYPLIIHTGEISTCNAAFFAEYFDKFPDVKFILAHGRPFNETLTILRKYSNVYVDTAFMPVSLIKVVCMRGFWDRVLWGTDYPIHWPQQSYIASVQYWFKVLFVKCSLSKKQSDCVLYKNFQEVFNMRLDK